MLNFFFIWMYVLATTVAYYSRPKPFSRLDFILVATTPLPALCLPFFGLEIAVAVQIAHAIPSYLLYLYPKFIQTMEELREEAEELQKK